MKEVLGIIPTTNPLKNLKPGELIRCSQSMLNEIKQKNVKNVLFAQTHIYPILQGKLTGDFAYAEIIMDYLLFMDDILEPRKSYGYYSVKNIKRYKDNKFKNLYIGS